MRRAQWAVVSWWTMSVPQIQTKSPATGGAALKRGPAGGPACETGGSARLERRTPGLDCQNQDRHERTGHAERRLRLWKWCGDVVCLQANARLVVPASSALCPRFGITYRRRHAAQPFSTDGISRSAWLATGGEHVQAGDAGWADASRPSGPPPMCGWPPSASPGRAKKVERGWFGPAGGGYGNSHCPVPQWRSWSCSRSPRTPSLRSGA